MMMDFYFQRSWRIPLTLQDYGVGFSFGAKDKQFGHCSKSLASRLIAARNKACEGLICNIRMEILLTRRFQETLQITLIDGRSAETF